MKRAEDLQLLPRRADTDLFDLAHASFEELLVLRTRAEAMLHNEHVTPTSVDNMRTYFRELALGAGFVREKLGSEAVPERFVVWGVSPQTSLPTNLEDRELMCEDSINVVLGITPKALISVGPGYIPKDHNNPPSEDYDGKGQLFIAEQSIPCLPSLVVVIKSVNMALARGVTTRMGGEELCAEAVLRWEVSGTLHGKDHKVTKLTPSELASWYREHAARKCLN